GRGAGRGIGAHDVLPGSGHAGAFGIGEELARPDGGGADGEAPVGARVAGVQRVLAARRVGAVDVLRERGDAIGLARGGVDPGPDGDAGGVVDVDVQRGAVGADLVPV